MHLHSGVPSGSYKTISDVELATTGWADWSNARRLHLSLGMATRNRPRARLLRGSHDRAEARIRGMQNLGRFNFR
ncbi:hypothetical protein C8K36_110108 [Rhodococcus sp. OK519]|nr:hypothetical protein C8K36_110108 [Rhodococcus sp. OK519]